MHSLILNEAVISQHIFLIRGEKVMFDFHLSLLYEVETRILKQAVRRNKNRFPDDFMFELRDEEINWLVEQNAIANRGILGGAKPMAFTEQGVAMLSSVLRSDRAIEVNIAVIRTFVQLRTLMLSNVELNKKIEGLEEEYNEKFRVVFEAIKELIAHAQTDPEPKRTPVGYKRNKKQN